MKNILIVSPIPFAPNWEGNRKRVEQMTNLFIENGDTVHFLHVNHAKGNENEMKKNINGKFYFLEDRKEKSYRQPWYLRTLISKATKIYSLCNLPLDAWYFAEIRKKINEIIKENSIEIIVCEYIFYSKCLVGINNILKIIDTHDIFSDRYKVFLEMNRRPQWFSTSPRNESKALNRCDIAIAIQTEDERYFKSISKAKVITLPFAPKPLEVKKRKRNEVLKLCFIGSHNDVNVSAINSFMDEIYPALEKIKDKFEITIGGSVVNHLNPIDKYYNIINYVDRIENLEEFFLNHDALINPTKTGTGLPIKVLEALANGLHVIGSKSGVRGIKDREKMKSIHVCEQPLEWIDKISELFELKKYSEISEFAYKDYSKIYKDKLSAEEYLLATIKNLSQQSITKPF